MNAPIPTAYARGLNSYASPRLILGCYFHSSHEDTNFHQVKNYFSFVAIRAFYEKIKQLFLHYALSAAAFCPEIRQVWIYSNISGQKVAASGPQLNF